ncbi:hypothetical protein Q8F55_001406 [Vanrija albida]|uniref:HTH CENPB-type domain-containing protein n=1 Tax=Vanrija albida TaxID=181172 RepID=A0ABR3QGT5_9TREE
MAAPLATPSYLNEEVDFMTMFTNQNDDNGESSGPAVAQQSYDSAAPTPSLPHVDPLHVFDTPALTPAASWSPIAAHRGQMSHAPYGYQAQMYAPAHYQHVAPMAQYVETSSLPGARPASAPTLSAFGGAPGISTPPPAPSSEGNGPPPSAATTASSNTAILSPDSAAAASPLSSASVKNEPVAATERAQVRRKRKLTPEDKRRICEIYRNSQGKIRQEDIAKEYSVDRSTISKILNQEDRWLDPEQPNANAALARRPGGRYPAIEEAIHRWLDEAVLEGREVKDTEAREEALKMGLRLGHPHFQASSKWWDGVKRRRLEEGRSMPTMRRVNSQVQPSVVIPGGGLVRSYSAMTMDGAALPHDAYHQFPMHPHAGPSHYQLVDPSVGVHPGMMLMQAMPIGARARSQSNPQAMPGYVAQQPPSFGPARHQRSPPRHSPVTPLGRPNSFHGAANESPSRTAALSRANSSQGRRSPHTRLGASAFGLTPVRGPDPASAQTVPPLVASTPQASTEQASVSTPTSSGPIDTTVTTPGTAFASASVPSLSPHSGSDGSSDANGPTALGLSPGTPLTPSQATVPSAFSPAEYLDLNGGVPPLVYAAGPHYEPRQAPMIYAHAPLSCVPAAGMVQYTPAPMYPGYEYAVNHPW